MVDAEQKWEVINPKGRAVTGALPRNAALQVLRSMNKHVKEPTMLNVLREVKPVAHTETVVVGEAQINRLLLEPELAALFDFYKVSWLDRTRIVKAVVKHA